MAVEKAKEKAIIFSGESVQQILAGRKTMTRRVAKLSHNELCYLSDDYGSRSQFGQDGKGNSWTRFTPGKARPDLVLKYAPFQVGVRLWVRETWAKREDVNPEEELEKAYHYLVYRADRSEGDDLSSDWHDYGKGWRSPLFMPRWASRITLEITDVRVERLMNITEAGAVAEGHERREHFLRAWDDLNAKRGFPTYDDPWCWVVSFQVVS